MSSKKYTPQLREYPSLFQQRTKIEYLIRNGSEKSEDYSSGDNWSISIEAFRSNGDNDELFVNHIWEGAIVLADYIVEHNHLFHNRTILELGAGCALPSLVASKFHSKQLICTDYNDTELLEYIKSLTITNHSPHIQVEPFNWTDNPQSLLKLTDSAQSGFDYIFCAELLWKDTLPVMSSLFSVMKSLLKDQHSKILFCFAERLCEGFTHELVETNIDQLLAVNGFQPKQLLLTSNQYRDAIEYCPSKVYLYQFSVQ